MKLTGKLIEIGNLNDGEPGIVIRLRSSRLVTLSGLSRDEVKALAPYFGAHITLTVDSSVSENGL